MVRFEELFGHEYPTKSFAVVIVVTSLYCIAGAGVYVLKVRDREGENKKLGVFVETAKLAFYMLIGFVICLAMVYANEQKYQHSFERKIKNILR